MTDDRIAVYCGTRNIYPHMVGAAKSLLYHNGADRVFFLIEDDTFPEPLPSCIETINVSGQTYFPRDGPNFSQKWTYMVLMRVALPKVFPQYDRVLSMDVDTVVLNSIDALWETDIDDAYMAMAREEYPGFTYEHPMYNAGVMLMNLSKLRKDGMDDNLIHMLNTQRLPYNEQEAINHLCWKNVVRIPPEFNAMDYVKDEIPDQCARIIHCFNRMRYDDNFFYRKFNRMSWDRVLTHRDSLKVT